ncbi:MAG: hypothetical protein ACKO6R_09440, partial [Burkholderiaceae bacterium]
VQKMKPATDRGDRITTKLRGKNSSPSELLNKSSGGAPGLNTGHHALLTITLDDALNSNAVRTLESTAFARDR